MNKFILTVFLLLLFPLNIFAYSKAVVDITEMGIKDMEDALSKGYLTSETLTKLYLERIDTYDKDFNAIREINENALEEARLLDKEREKGHIRGPLHGIPILVKTNIDVQGLPTTAGSKALKDNYPNEDSYVVAKLKEAGAIILASTNMSEFAFSAVNSRSSYGNVKNAFNTLYTPYGSSGGSAVGVALSFGAAALGTDTNSSVRLPAAAAGLVGLRPSLGLVNNKGVIPYDTERDTVGIITKTVMDNATILDIIGNDVEYDNVKSIDQKYVDINEDIGNIKVGVVKSYLEGSSLESGPFGKTDEAILALIREKLSLFESMGANLVDIDSLIDNHYLSIANSTVSGITFCDGFNEYIKNTQGSIRSFKDLASSSGKIYSLSGYLSGCNGKTGAASRKSKKDEFEQHILEVMNTNDLDVIVYPVFKKKISTLTSEASASSPGSSLGSVIGYPSITVPVGYLDGLPYGLEFFSTKFNEKVLYSIANAFQKATDLKITNSPLAPSLYEIPDSIDELKKLYERYYDMKEFESLTRDTRDFFKNYSGMDDETSRKQADDLIEEYDETIKMIDEKERVNCKINRIEIILFAIGITYLLAYRSNKLYC